MSNVKCYILGINLNNPKSAEENPKESLEILQNPLVLELDRVNQETISLIPKVEIISQYWNWSLPSLDIVRPSSPFYTHTKCSSSPSTDAIFINFVKMIAIRIEKNVRVFYESQHSESEPH